MPGRPGKDAVANNEVFEPPAARGVRHTPHVGTKVANVATPSSSNLHDIWQNRLNARKEMPAAYLLLKCIFKAT